jgi:hypothetical protein
MANTAGSWPHKVAFVKPGDTVSAGNVNRPARNLEERTQYLKERLDGLQQNSAVIGWDQPVRADVLVCQPVYWNAVDHVWDLAMAGAEQNADGAFVATPASNARGLVLSKPTATSAHIVMFGLVPLSDLANAIDGEITPGSYYLSAADPGKLTQQRPPVGVYICTVLGVIDRCSDLSFVHVAPAIRDFQFDHTHYRFDLTCLPAGTASPPTYGDAHYIADPDESLPGWLPANHESFGGHAPIGAQFGYNLTAHPTLSRIWPPIPLGAASLIWDKGLDHVGGTEIPLGQDGLVMIDAYGIWWMSNCYGDVPWPRTYNSSDSLTSDSSLSSSAECPRAEQMRLSLVFLRNLLGAAKAVVTSLAPATGSPLILTNCDGDVAATGDLKIGLNLDNVITDDASKTSGLVVKEVTAGLGFKREYVVSLLRAGSDKVLLTSTKTRLRDPDDADSTIYQEEVTIDLEPNPGDRELSPQVVKLGDAVERTYRDTPYIGFPAGRSSAIIGSYDVPYAGLPTTPQVKVRLLILGLTSGTLPALVVGYKIIPRPNGSATPSAVPTDLTAVTIATNVAVTGGDVIEINGTPFDVAAGDKVIVQVSRAGSAGYLGELGIIRLAAVLVAGA